MRPAKASHRGHLLQFMACLFITLTVSGCANQLIHQREKTSRDWIYIHFAHNQTPYTHQGQVGGEHTSFVKVLAFEGDRFSVTLQQQGDAGFTVYGENVRLERNGARSDVVVEGPETIFTIEISALTYGDYILTIRKR